MIDRIFSDPAMSVLRQALDASSVTHETISHNLANVDTPGYKRSEVVFQDKLAAALRDMTESSSKLQGALTNPAHIAINEPAPLDSVKPSVYVRAETTLRPDGNNVDIDSEMTKLSQNMLVYQTLTQLVGSKIAQLRTAISEGRR